MAIEIIFLTNENAYFSPSSRLLVMAIFNHSTLLVGYILFRALYAQYAV